ncbi:MAG: N-6 DNA methylase [bacterium]
MAKYTKESDARIIIDDFLRQAGWDPADKSHVLTEVSVDTALHVVADAEPRGLKTADLDEEHYDPAEFERKWTNEDSNRKMIQEFDRLACESYKELAPGQKIGAGKTIVFAITKHHAARLTQYLNDLHPECKGKYAEVITSDVMNADDLIRQFKYEDYPQVAVSVGMLDTGFDCREVLHLVMCRRVRSPILYQQMRGRGTRTAPHIDKRKFVIYDFFDNHKYFNDSDTDIFTGTGRGVPPERGERPLPRSLMELGLEDEWLEAVTYVEVGPGGERLLERSIFGFDVSRQMMRIAMMNLVLHGIRQARVKRANTLSDIGGLSEEDLHRRYKVILSNPPFAGVLPKDSIRKDLPTNSKKSELLFLGVMLEALAPGGRGAVVVPEGLLFGSTSAHVELRRKLVEEFELLAAAVRKHRTRTTFPICSNSGGLTKPPTSKCRPGWQPTPCWSRAAPSRAAGDRR